MSKKIAPISINSGVVKSESPKPSREGTLSGLTTEEVRSTDVNRVTKPVDLTREELRRIGLDSPVAQLQRGVVRLRILLNGETIASGSGFVVSSDGLIVSNNHVPAIGKQAGASPFDFFGGKQVLRNLKTWSELLGQKGDVRLVADFPLLPKPELPETIFTARKEPILTASKSKIAGFPFAESDDDERATTYGSHSDTIDFETYDLQIIAESPGEDIVLAAVVRKQGEGRREKANQDPFSLVRITDSELKSGQLVYSIGHPLGIPHNALALGEVLDPRFNVDKIQKALEAHGVIGAGILNAIGLGSGLPGEHSLSEMAKIVSTGLAGIDVEPLANFLNGAVVSTNNIDHGSSGGLLCNENREAVGITYLSLAVPFGNTALLRYAGGTLGFHPEHLPLSHITGSVGVGKKVIPFIEEQGISVTKIRDGEPVGVESLAKRASKARTRDAMRVFLIGEGVSNREISRRLKAAGLAEDEEPQSKTDTKARQDETPESAHYIGTHVFKSKPTKILSLEIGPNTKNRDKATAIVVRAKVATERKPEGETVKLTVDPKNFGLHSLDEHTRGLAQAFVMQKPKLISDLTELQGIVKRNTESSVGDDGTISRPYRSKTETRKTNVASAFDVEIERFGKLRKKIDAIPDDPTPPKAA